ncbi:MAG: ORF6N domain-containing protein [Planctomycetaceae bacterium]|nr:ORF6N domain-containing protein [Planctomycetaceae bacterium]
MKFNRVEEKIITIRDQSVILDSDVAELYGITTKEINQAVKNNPEKFPIGYICYYNSKRKIRTGQKF